MKFVVLRVHGGLGKDWLVCGGGLWVDGLKVVACNHHGFLLEL